MVTATPYTIPVRNEDSLQTHREVTMVEILAKLHAVMFGGAIPDVVLGNESPEMLLRKYAEILVRAPKSVLPQS
jgi:hypothetical protein